MADTIAPLLFNVEDIVETVREPMLVLSADLRVQRANRSFYRTFKVSPDETVDRLVYDLGNRQWDIPALRKLLDEILPQHTFFEDFEVVHEFDSIGQKIMLLNARRIHHEGNNTEFILLAIEDITEQQRLEKLRQELETRFTSLVRNIKDHSVFTLDAEGKITSWNVEAERILGWTEAEAIGQHFSIIFTPEDLARDQPETELRTAREEGRAEDERWHIKKSGEWFWALGIVTPTHDDEGNNNGYSKILRDMTDRKRAEEALVKAHDELEQRVEERTEELGRTNAALRESEERLRLLADTIPQLAWMARPDGHIFWYNRRWYEYTGTTPDQMEGWGWESVHDPEVLPKVLMRWKASLANGEPFDMVFPLKGADDKFRPFLTRVNPLRDQEGRVLHWFGTNTDISEIKEMEEALRDTDRRKDEFLATLAHELRNPLAPIRNSLEILKMPSVDTETAQQTRDMMERQVHQLVRMVDDLLDVSRVMRGKIELRRERVELASIVAGAIEAAQPIIEVQGHELSLSLPPESLLLDADPVRLAQVIGNLLTNAAKYTEANGHIWLAAWREGEQVVLSVRDKGIGIAPNMLPHVFELFVQADHASTKSHGGLGIGLTLVKNLVEMHNGSVEARSGGLGKGCEFVVRLPFMVQELQQPNDKENGEQQPDTSSVSHRLLVVDDNKDAATSFAMLLRLKGHEVQVAHDGPSALALATSYRPDTVFLDIGMPGMDGYEVAQRLRQHPELKNVVLAALTGWGQEEDRRHTAEAGFDHHLVKPPDLTAVEGVLAEFKKP